MLRIVKEKLKKLPLFRDYVVMKKAYKMVRALAVDNIDIARFEHCGNHVDVGTNNTLVPENIVADDFTRIQNMVNMISYHGKLKIGKYSCIGSQCIIIPGSHTPTVGLPQYLSKLHINDEDRHITIHEDCWIGAGCIILSRAEFGRGCVVGAGSIVTKQVPPYAVAVGSPLKIVASRFTKEQILAHERILYPPEERMLEEEIDQLFDTYFKDLKAIGTSEMTAEEADLLNETKEQLGMTDYSAQ